MGPGNPPPPETGCEVVKWNIGGSTGNLYIEILEDDDCDGIADVYQAIAHPGNPTYTNAHSRDPDEDCYLILVEAGIITPSSTPPNPPSGSTATFKAKVFEFKAKHATEIPWDFLMDNIHPTCESAQDFDECAEEDVNAELSNNEDGHIDVLDVGNSEYIGAKQKIPECIKLSGGHEVDVVFGVTASDNTSANQEVAECVIDALVSALECASASYTIDEIYISATTNGKHSPSSNHSRALAIDLSRINGVKMALMNSTQLETVEELQDCLELYSGIRENFGPSLKNKLGQPYSVGGHSDHMHFSVNSGTTCNYDETEIECD